MTIVFALLAGAVVFAATRLLVGRRNVVRLERRVRAHVQTATQTPQDPGPAGAGRIRTRLDELERTVSRYRKWDAIVLRLERAGVERRPIDVVAALTSATLLIALLVGLASPFLGFVVLVAVPGVGWLTLGTLADRRVRAFDQQLPDLLAALSSSLRAGHGFLQSLQAVAHDAPAPAGPELRRALAETRAGRPVDEALAGVAARIPSKDLSYVLTAIAVQRQVGGSLAGLFETVNDTVRQRQQFARKVRALTATGRASAWALVGLPFGVAALMSLVNHTYLVPLFTSATGRLMLMLALVSLLAGTVLVRRIVVFKG